VKALFLTNEYPPHVYGGAGVHVEYLVRELSRMMQVEVRCFGDQLMQSNGLEVRGVQVTEGLLATTDKPLRSPLGALARNVDMAALPAGDADVVHCHTWYSHFGGILVKMLYGLPLVITTHSLEPLRPWKREQLGRGYDFSAWVERTALQMADAVIAVSDETREDILRLFEVDPGRVRVIPNGIDTEQYQQTSETDALERYGIPADLPYVLFVGRIARQKGIIHLVRAIQHLPPDTGVVLCAGQPDTAEIAEEMQRSVAGVQASRPNVVWIREMVPRETAIQLYSHARVFCCPSIYEPFGIINLEAMACGTPVVASAVGGIREIVVPGETGTLVPFEQQTEPPFEALHPEQYSRDLAAALTPLLADPELAARLGRAGRQRVEQLFSWRSVARRVAELYRELCAAQ
jgi:glycogen synthase